MMPRPSSGDLPLHVLTLTPFFPSDLDEVSGCFIAEPIKELKQFGVHSSVIAVAPFYYARKSPIPAAPAEFVRYPQIPGTHGLSSAGKLLYARLLRRIQELHGVHPIDVIHAHAALPCGEAAAILARRLSIPFVVTVHGLDVFNTCFLDGVAAAWRRKVSVDVYSTARTVLCISGRVQEVLKTGTAAEIRSMVLYNGVDPDLFSPAAGSQDLDQEILVVGNLLRSKGQELVLKAFGNLRLAFPKLRCRIVGEGPDRSYLEGLAQNLGISERIHFAGLLRRSEVAAAMQRCSIFVLPSSNEGLGCVYLEAMSCGKPVIGCRGQGIDEVIKHGENGWLVPANSLEELMGGVATLLGSSELRARMGSMARETVLKSFTLSQQAQHLATIYREAAV
jgi:teichuronic acid biosynthesis glycosyltransferase TuaC